MIALCFGILGALIGVFRREAAELITVAATAVLRRRQSFLDRFLPARRMSGYAANLR